MFSVDVLLHSRLSVGQVLGDLGVYQALYVALSR